MGVPGQAIEAVAGEEAASREAPVVHTPPPVASRVAGLAGPAAAAGVLALWLVVRPSAPNGLAAVIDLLALPALLFAGARLAAGRPTIPAAGFAVLFGLGAVFATLAALVVEWPADRLLSPAAAGAVGALVETLAPAVPVALVAALLIYDRRIPTMTDMALAGLACGLGFLVVQTSLVTAAGRRAPSYVSPAVAGWQRVEVGGVDLAHFVGPGVATALIGVALGATVRCRSRRWRLAPPLVVVLVVVLDRAVFERQLRHAVVAEAPPLSGAVDLIQRLTLSGRLELVLLVLGLVVAGWETAAVRLWHVAERPLGRRRARAEDPRLEAAGAADQADDEVTQAVPDFGSPDFGSPDFGSPDFGSPDVGLPLPPPASAPPSDRPLAAAFTLGVALAAGALFVALARTRHAGFLQDRPVALAVAAAGFCYGLLRLGNLRVTLGAQEAEEALPRDDGRHLLCLAAVAAAGLGLVSAFWGAPAPVRPVHGGVLLDAVRGWGAQVGRLGLLFGLGGLAAPPGPLRPPTAGGWSDLLPWRIGSSGWYRGLAPGGGIGWGGLWRRRRRGGAEGTALGWSEFWRLRPGRWTRGAGARRRGWRGRWLLRGSGGGSGRGGSGRLPWWFGRWRPPPPPAGDEAEGDGPLRSSITIEPLDEAAQSRVEYQGATVQDAMLAALADHDVGRAGASLQLVDPGLPPKAGKPGSGQPARVRVIRDRDDVAPLLPPGRGSVCRSSPFSVVVEVVDPAVVGRPRGSDTAVVLATVGSTPPHTVEVTLSNPSHPSDTRTLTCSREAQSPGRARYRSNSFTLERGEDPTWVAVESPARAMRVDDGEQLRVAYGEQASEVTVYDGWVRQVIEVNRALFDVAEAHHVTAVTAVTVDEQELAAGGQLLLERLRRGLDAVEEGRRLCSSEAPDDERVFLGTAILHRALCLDAGDGGQAVMAAAVEALGEHRRAVEGDPGCEGMSPAYRHFLVTTLVGRLWATGAATDGVAEQLGWRELLPRDEYW